MKILLSIAAVLAILMLWKFPFHITDNEKHEAVKQKGVCWVAGRMKITANEFRKLEDLHVNWISQTPFGWQREPGSSEIITNTSNKKMWWGESDEGISETARVAHLRKIKTLLKPHLWVSKGWPGDIQMKSDADWSMWFSNYEKFILHYAELAEKNHLDILCIGTELQKTISREKEWRNLIKKIRAVYHGPLTYAANFYLEFEKIAFWDDLDYIGIQAYFPLSKSKDPTLSALMQGWETPLEAIEKIQQQFNKPVIFTEIGYRSMHDASIEPWRWPRAEDSSEACDEAQAACYRAFFQAVWNKKWLTGAYFWKWYPEGPHRLGAVDFTPQEKLAEKVMLEYFSK